MNVHTQFFSITELVRRVSRVLVVYTSWCTSPCLTYNYIRNNCFCKRTSFSSMSLISHILLLKLFLVKPLYVPFSLFSSLYQLWCFSRVCSAEERMIRIATNIESQKWLVYIGASYRSFLAV